jgi:hypothetical protein
VSGDGNGDVIEGDIVSGEKGDVGSDVRGDVGGG